MSSNPEQLGTCPRCGSVDPLKMYQGGGTNGGCWPGGSQFGDHDPFHDSVRQERTAQPPHERWCASVPRAYDGPRGIGPFRCDCEPQAGASEPSGEVERPARLTHLKPLTREDLQERVRQLSDKYGITEDDWLELEAYLGHLHELARVEPVARPEQRELFIVEHVTGEWLSSGENVDYSVYRTKAEAADARKAEADNTDEPISNYTLVRFIEIVVGAVAESEDRAAQDERAGFEAWANNPTHQIFDEAKHFAWIGWQAAGRARSGSSSLTGETKNNKTV